MSLAKHDLRVIRGGKGYPSSEHYSVSNLQSADDSPICPPPNLLVGMITATLGAGVGVLSLLVFFTLRQPDSYISKHWLIFVFAGAILGFFLRFERSLDGVLSPMRTRAPNPK